MCIRYHSVYRCKHTGEYSLDPCGEISGPPDTFCTTDSTPSNRSFCCSAKCCNKAFALAKTRFSEALADVEAWNPSIIAWICWNKYTREQKEQLEKRLRAAKEYRDGEEQLHWWCYQTRLAAREEGRELGSRSSRHGRVDSGTGSLATVEEEVEEESERRDQGEIAEAAADGPTRLASA